ncbi:MAG: hypothetical protein AB9866_16880 [Syntrophobacteraceae bacterium]
MGIDVDKDFLSMLEAPWLKKQIETHLIFGFCSRKVPLAVLFIAVCIAYILYQVWSSNDSFLNQLINNTEFLFFLIVGTYMLRMPKYQQAAIGWWTVKGSLVLMCITGIIGYGLVGFFKGSPDAMHVTLLALIWFPCLEFIPSLTEKQKYITIVRIVVSIPLLILWHRTGTWI